MNEAGNVTITILADNAAAPPYRAEHGFSALVEIRAKNGNETNGLADDAASTVLFDTGMGALFDNAVTAGVDLARVTDVVLSHGHYDHTDALEEFLRRYPGVTVHASVDFFRDHYSVRTGNRRKIALSDGNRLALSKLADGGFDPFVGEAALANGRVSLASGIPRDHPLEIPSPLLFSDADCTVGDAVPDELVLWMGTARGLVILTGCCHAGFINTCEFARRLSGVDRIRAVIGGFHLAGVPEERMKATADYIRAHGIALVVPCHCTGNDEIDWLASRLGPVVSKGRCGMQLDLTDGVKSKSLG
jgi:7,8-dihydropterin-6-yl-methyl-4-(beta-D-ribofuranosyl)aminobenzene 5'-phosphate synthase